MLKCKCNFANFFKHKSNGLCSFALLLPLLDILPFILLFSSGNSAFNETESTLWTWHFLFSWHKLLNFYYLMHFSSFLLPVAPHHQPRPSRFLMGFFPKLLSLFPAIWRLMTLSIWKSKLLMLFSWKKTYNLFRFRQMNYETFFEVVDSYTDMTFRKRFWRKYFLGISIGR